MGVDPADGFAVKPVVFDEDHGLLVRGELGLGQRIKKREDLFSLSDVSAGQFANDEFVPEDDSFIQNVGKVIVTLAEVIDPDGGVDKNHAAEDRLLVAFFSFFSVPPSAASLFALSRAMSASSPRRTNAVFSETPVSLSASSRRSSSMFSVVLICTSMRD